MKKSFLEITENDVDKKSRIKRLYDGVFKNGIINVHGIVEIPEKVRNKIDDNFDILSLEEVERQTSDDGTIKFLFKLQDGLYIESVFLVDERQHVTMCISSQVGCRMGCKFCRTAQLGLKRNLTAYEIVSQVIYIFHIMVSEKKITDRVFNIVYMGMGEPFDNFDNLLQSIKILTDKSCFSLHPSWITVSTCGIMDKAEVLLDNFPRTRIAVSLNCAINEKREQIMGVTKRFPVNEIFETLNRIYSKYKRRLTLEYVLIKDFNDTDEDIKALELFNSKAFHLNIIPLNSSFNGYKMPSDEEAISFRRKLNGKDIFVSMRMRRGADIQADCGQLCLSNMNKN